MTDLPLIVMDTRVETPSIRRLVLAHADGGPLPGFDAGAHITIAVPDVGARKYSLMAASVQAVTGPAPRAYEIGVRLDVDGGGGSRYVHALKVGDRLSVEPPRNNFPITPGMSPVALVAGGIGVTPLLTMAAALTRQARPFRFVYAARSASELAFLREIRALAGDHLTVHTDDAAGRVFDVQSYLSALPPDTKVYACGPKPMLKAAMDAVKKLGWPRDRLAFELFYSVAPGAAPAPPPVPVTDGSFEVVLKSSGKTFRVPKDQTILDVLIDAGEDPVHDCKRGECGVCQVGVIEGIPDHKDHILSASERASNKFIQICISRSKSPKLVLDV